MIFFLRNLGSATAKNSRIGAQSKLIGSTHGPNPVKTRRGSNTSLMLPQRRRRWANIKLALGQRLNVLAGRVVVV